MARRSSSPPAPSLADRLARLVRERGWTAKQFAQAARIDPRTAAALCAASRGKIRNDILKAAATALDVSVDELYHAPLPELLARMRAGQDATSPAPDLLAMRQPVLARWLADHPQHDLQREEIEELASIQGTGGPLTEEGLAHYLDLIRRKRKLVRQIAILAGTPYLPMLEELAKLMLAQLDPRQTLSAVSAPPEKDQ